MFGLMSLSNLRLVSLKVIQEILSEIWLFVAIKMGATDFFLPTSSFHLDILFTPHIKQ
jgi:hypothetical protein